MFSNRQEERDYILENYTEVTDSRVDDNHWDIYCGNCNIVRGFQVIRYSYQTEEGEYDGTSFDTPYSIYFKCPVCQNYKFWIVFTFPIQEVREDGKTYSRRRTFKVHSLPSDSVNEIEQLPDEPVSLKIAYKEAIRCMDGGAHIAAAAMFRRALQIITRNILGAKPGNLANELKEVADTEYNGAKISKNFSDVGYIIKEVGNQGAHPDSDPDLLRFTPEDTQDLHNIFLEIVSELFVVPEAKKKTREEFLRRRKISS